MKTNLYFILIIFILFSWECETGQKQGKEQIKKIRFVGWDYEWMQKIKKELNDGDQKYLPAYGQLIKNADAALNSKPFSVTYKKFIPPSGNKHDYMSMGPYWWPDPEKENGLPYIKKDGEVNPERNETDRPQLGRLINNVRSLSMAWFFSGEQKYAAKAAELLRVWFLDEETYMNPHLEYAQSIPGRNPGRSIGVIDAASFYVLVDAISLLETSATLSEKEKDGIRTWFERYFRWLVESGHGKEEDNYKNNHSVSYDVQAASVAYFLGDDDFIARKVREAPRRRIDPMIEGDGSQPEELIRTKALLYSSGNIENFFRLGEGGMKVGVNIFGYVNPKGGSIQKALGFLIPYIGKEKDWPYNQISDWEYAENLLGLMVRRAARIYENEDYQKIWEDNFSERLKTHWRLLVVPEYQINK